MRRLECWSCTDGMGRYIEIAAVEKFQQDMAKSGNVTLARSLYYDEDNAHLYPTQPKTEEQAEDLPFVHQGSIRLV